ncbi:hypothetical protein SUNI508_02910 [Seiridium unicorne]|uniref:Uncharacterized protein n=1 Tax=Seiridium unicorne TaxID=138068 RepID=A0ABR2VHS9_9PEZI
MLFQRVLKEGKDSRFDEIKLSPPKFFGAWMAQTTWVSLCLMPVIAVNSIPPAVFAALPGLKITAFLGLALYSYPNYFAESTLWTGIATSAAGILVTLPVHVGLGLSGGLGGQLLVLGLSYVSPAFVTLLLTKVSGIPMSESKYDKKD